MRVRLTGVSHAHAALVSNPERWINETRLRGSSYAGRLGRKLEIETRSPVDLAALRNRLDHPLGEVLRDGITAPSDRCRTGGSDRRSQADPGPASGCRRIRSRSALYGSPGDRTARLLDEVERIPNAAYSRATRRHEIPRDQSIGLRPLYESTVSVSIRGSKSSYHLRPERGRQKHTFLRAISGVLYDIEVQTRDDFIHAKPELRIGAKLEHSSGAERALVQRGKPGTTLLDTSGRPVDESQLKSWLSIPDGDLFRQMFGLSHEQLRGRRQGPCRCRG